MILLLGRSAVLLGLPEFTKLSLAFAYGKDSQALKENRIAGIQVRT